MFRQHYLLSATFLLLLLSGMSVVLISLSPITKMFSYFKIKQDNLKRMDDFERVRFDDIFGVNWPPSKPLGVVYYLLRDVNTNKRMWEAMSSVNSRFLRFHPYPVVLFYDGSVC